MCRIENERDSIEHCVHRVEVGSGDLLREKPTRLARKRASINKKNYCMYYHRL